MKEEIPKRKQAEKKGKVTIYMPLWAKELYHLAQKNGWDTPAVVSNAAVEVLKKYEQKLRSKS